MSHSLTGHGKTAGQVPYHERGITHEHACQATRSSQRCERAASLLKPLQDRFPNGTSGEIMAHKPAPAALSFRSHGMLDTDEIPLILSWAQAGA
jgi:hypothetical protein